VGSGCLAHSRNEPRVVRAARGPSAKDSRYHLTPTQNRNGTQRPQCTMLCTRIHKGCESHLRPSHPLRVTRGLLTYLAKPPVSRPERHSGALLDRQFVSGKLNGKATWKCKQFTMFPPHRGSPIRCSRGPRWGLPSLAVLATERGTVPRGEPEQESRPLGTKKS
jgi:hypothetical protein